VADVGQDFAFLCRDADSGVQVSVLRLRDKGTDNRDNVGGVARDGGVDPVVGEPEIAQAGEEGGGRGRRRLIGRVATYPTLEKCPDRRDVGPRSLVDVGGGPWWRGWGRPARMRGRRWRGGSCRLHICRSTAGIPPPPVAPWPVQGWLRGRGQAQWGLGSPGSENGRGVDREGVAGGNAEGMQTSEEVRGIAGVRDGESAGEAVVRDGEAKKLGSNGVGFGVVKGRETRDKEVEVRAVPILDAKVVND
jgi:hypothetical protein